MISKSTTQKNFMDIKLVYYFLYLENLNNTLLQFYAHESSRQWSTIVNEAEQSRLR